MGKAPKGHPNVDLGAAFTELAQLEAKAGGSWSASAYKKAAKILGEHPKKINSGSEARKLPGIGPAIASKVQEFIDSGSIGKLDDLREEFGDSSVPKADMSPTKPTTAQSKKMKNEAAALGKYTIPELKRELSRNLQRIGGKKGELMARVAEGRVMGACPPCPVCHLGKGLRYDPSKGMYDCPGGFDDDTFIPCAFRAGKVDRLKWVIVLKDEEEDTEEEQEEN